LSLTTIFLTFGVKIMNASANGVFEK
jgi:hypothetical protein